MRRLAVSRSFSLLLIQAEVFNGDYFQMRLVVQMNSLVQMGNAFKNVGSVTLTMIALTILMN